MFCKLFHLYLSTFGSAQCGSLDMSVNVKTPPTHPPPKKIRTIDTLPLCQSKRSHLHHSHSLRHEISRRPPLATVSTTKMNQWRVLCVNPSSTGGSLHGSKPLWNLLSCPDLQRQEWYIKKKKKKKERLHDVWNENDALMLLLSWLAQIWLNHCEILQVSLQSEICSYGLRYVCCCLLCSL